jgi:hypothetical protein
MKSKIFWTVEERTALVEEIASLKGTIQVISLLQALYQAQDTVLHESRRRTIVSESVLPWLREAVDKEVAKRKAEKEKAEQDKLRLLDEALAAATIPQLVETLSAKLGLREYMGSLLDDLLLRSSVVKRLEQELKRFQQPVSDLGISTGKSTERSKPRIVILGLKNAQQHIIEQDFAAVCNLRFLDKYAHNTGLVADHVLGMIDFMPHTTDTSAKKHFGDRYHRVGGTLTSLRNTLRSLLK